VTVQSSEFER